MGKRGDEDRVLGVMFRFDFVDSQMHLSERSVSEGSLKLNTCLRTRPRTQVQ